MVKYVSCAAPLILLVKLPVTTTNQAIGYTNITSDLQLALGVSMSLIVHKSHVK